MVKVPCRFGKPANDFYYDINLACFTTAKAQSRKREYLLVTMAVCLKGTMPIHQALPQVNSHDSSNYSSGLDAIDASGFKPTQQSHSSDNVCLYLLL